jgi:hypothetical protein
MGGYGIYTGWQKADVDGAMLLNRSYGGGVVVLRN